ncbi:hypothetical protein [Streptomyces zagrosensis]|uniref:Uncharacterized protein n=1 Tax=Streptomyces zagrosensis TaxID=1042984 RepID=A0A7W9UZ76_9ACTN|nr:hypothetical protein [Streptomyces zagrosensis]MBB5936467.1 hypothetical protein [Streptomyces zagrosensis]
MSWLSFHDRRLLVAGLAAMAVCNLAVVRASGIFCWEGIRHEPSRRAKPMNLPAN